MKAKPELSRRHFLSTTTTAAAALAAGIHRVAGQDAGQAPGPVVVRDDRTVLDLRVHDRPFATYNFDSTHAGLYRPFFHPVMGPNDKPITQNGEFPGTLRGHYWHRALFVAHQKVTDHRGRAVSFWEERQADCGRMVHLRFSELHSGDPGRFVQHLAWRDLRGETLVEETRTVEIPAVAPEQRILDLRLRLRAAREAVTFERTPYNLLACRVINAMCRRPEKESYTRRFGPLVDFAPLAEGGRITNANGKVDDACRGDQARWCDFSGPLGDGAWGGVAILDHPANPRHPTPWHNWNNMTIMASPTYHEPWRLEPGNESRLAYRVLVHTGNAEKADVEAAWRRFAATAPF